MARAGMRRTVVYINMSQVNCLLEAGLEVGGHPGEEGGEVHLVPALDEADQEEAGPGTSEDGDLAGGEGVTCNM